jgi:Tfp pilus assembly pilus retraction ATPase PilT
MTKHDGKAAELRCVEACRERQLLEAKAELLATQSRISQSEKERDEARESALESMRLRNQWMTKHDGKAAELRCVEAKLAQILAITNTPEWFDSPCARAVREVVGEK